MGLIGFLCNRDACAYQYKFVYSTTTKDKKRTAKGSCDRQSEEELEGEEDKKERIGAEPGHKGRGFGLHPDCCWLLASASPLVNSILTFYSKRDERRQTTELNRLFCLYCAMHMYLLKIIGSYINHKQFKDPVTRIGEISYAGR